MSDDHPPEVPERGEGRRGETRRWTSVNVTYYAQEETVTLRSHGWETYEARCANGKTEREAQERLEAGDGVRIVGKRRAKRLTGDCSIDCLNACAYPGQFSECAS